MFKRLLALAGLLACLTGCTARPAPVPEQTPAPPTQSASPAPPAESASPTQSTPPPPTTTAAPPPTTVQGEYEAATAAIAKGALTEGEARLTRAVALDPTFGNAWLDLATLRLHFGYPHPSWPGATGQYKDAIEAAQQAARLLPSSAPAQYGLGLALLADARYADAVAPLREAARLQPKEPLYPTALGLALLGAGQAKDAVDACEAARQLDPKYVPAKVCLNSAGAGYTRIPDAEAAVGTYRYDGTHFVPGEKKQVDSQFERISPPWTCALNYTDGHGVRFYGCNSPRDWVYAESFTKAAVGATPAGVGVGKPWSLPAKVYGVTDTTDGPYHYVVANLILTIFGTPEAGITALSFDKVSPIFGIEQLLRAPITYVAAPAPLTRDDLQIGPVRLFATMGQVKAALGEPTRAEPGENPQHPTHIYEQQGLKIIYDEQGTVRYVWSTGAARTPRGIAVGDPVAKVRQLYGQPQQEWTGLVGYLPPELKNLWGIYFDVKDGRVTQVWTGLNK